MDDVEAGRSGSDRGERSCVEGAGAAGAGCDTGVGTTRCETKEVVEECTDDCVCTTGLIATEEGRGESGGLGPDGSGGFDAEPVDVDDERP